MSTQPEQWYVNLGSHQRGPMPLSEVIRGIKLGKVTEQARLYTKRLGQWTPAADVPEVKPYLQQPQHVEPPPLQPSSHVDGQLDYIIHGEESQYVEVALDPGEWCYSESDSMLYMEPGVQISTANNLLSSQDENGFIDSIIRAYQHSFVSEGHTFAGYVNQDTAQRKIALSPSQPGQIFPVEMGEGKVEHLYAGAGAFFAAGQHIKMNIIDYSANFFYLKYMQYFHGTGTLFLHSSGSLFKKTLQAGERLNINAESLFAFVGHPNQFQVLHQESTHIQMQGIFEMQLAVLTGPMTVWLQTHPVPRKIRNIERHLPRSK